MLLKVQFLADDVAHLVVDHCWRERRTASSRSERAGCACQAVPVVVAVVWVTVPPTDLPVPSFGLTFAVFDSERVFSTCCKGKYFSVTIGLNVKCYVTNILKLCEVFYFLKYLE